MVAVVHRARQGARQDIVRGKDIPRTCVGVDLHKDTMTVCVLDRRSGEVAYRKIACKCRAQVAEFFKALPRGHVVGIEAVGFYRWLWDLLEPIVDELHLA